ncbi:MAG: hypothetical protein NW220_17200 [Leptolyngbyaceae cyanobacterium bins.349]|nr:hypothetical protein [Leptolyngbyaceae cyanobacterium bins.349]
MPKSLPSAAHPWQNLPGQVFCFLASPPGARRVHPNFAELLSSRSGAKPRPTPSPQIGYCVHTSLAVALNLGRSQYPFLGGRPPKPPNVEDGCPKELCSGTASAQSFFAPIPPPEGTTGAMQWGWDGGVVG